MVDLLFELSWLLPALLLLFGCSLFLAACEYAILRCRFSPFDDGLNESIEQLPVVRNLLLNSDRYLALIRPFFYTIIFCWSVIALPLVQSVLIGYSLMTLPLLLIWPALILLLFTALGFCDYFGRSLGSAFPVQSLRIGCIPLRALAAVGSPLYLLSRNLSAVFWRLCRFRCPFPEMQNLDLESQLELIRRDTPELSTVAQLIFKNTLSMRDLVVSDVLLPRNQVRFFDINQPLQANLDMAKESGHTRFPLCFGDLDHCIGLIHIKDIFRYRGDISRLDVRKLKRGIIRIDGEEPLESALTKLLSHRMHMALVIDEFHGTEGVLTLERILEQLVGDIRDEFDADEEELIQPVEAAGYICVSGLTPLHEIEDRLGVSLENDEVSTIGGWVTSEFGRIPRKGEQLATDDMLIEVTDADETRVLQLRLLRLDHSPVE